MNVARNALLFAVLSLLTVFAGCQEAPDAALAEQPTVYEPAEETSAGDAEQPIADDNEGEPEASPVSTTAGAATDDAADDNGAADNNAGDDDGADKPSEKKAGDDEKEADAAAKSPYPQRIPMPELPKNADWINTQPLKMGDLKGKYVVFDFWTYCCINCIHVLPELKKLEKKRPNDVVVIGVHSAKFATEKDRDNIAEAVLRYEIEHPVLVDSDHAFWNKIGVRSWPTIMVVDPEGYVVFYRGGEIKYETLNQVIEFGIKHYRDNGLLDETPIRFDLLANKQEATPLRFPGKVMADEASERLFITDSNHNRIVISDLKGNVKDIIGSGAIGREDGDFASASFNKPQGLALDGDTLYVADTENHLLRKVDLKAKKVTTIAGLGSQASSPWPGIEGLSTVSQLPDRFVGKPLETAINSPWALWVHEDKLYIAMAGPHQIWMMPLNESEIGPFAGNGREDIVDGAHLPAQPYGQSSKEGKPVSSFAQPSGLASDGEYLFVADSEGSSIRAVPFDTSKEVRTVLGTEDLPAGRLFEFGDVDGPRDKAKLQHCLGVVYRDGKIYAADTYNNKVKVVDAKTGAAKTLAGDGKPGAGDSPAQFDEPAGITLAKGTLFVADTNNHQIRTVDLASGKVGTLKLAGLDPPKRATEKPNLANVMQTKVDATALQAKNGKIDVNVQLQLPFGWKINDLAPMRVWVEGSGDGPLKKEAFGYVEIDKPAATVKVSVEVEGDGKDQLTVFLPYYYCQSDGSGLCKAGEIAWIVPITIGKDGESMINLSHEVK